MQRGRACWMSSAMTTWSRCRRWICRNRSMSNCLLFRPEMVAAILGLGVIYWSMVDFWLELAGWLTNPTQVKCFWRSGVIAPPEVRCLVAVLSRRRGVDDASWISHAEFRRGDASSGTRCADAALAVLHETNKRFMPFFARTRPELISISDRRSSAL